MVRFINIIVSKDFMTGYNCKNKSILPGTACLFLSLSACLYLYVSICLEYI